MIQDVSDKIYQHDEMNSNKYQPDIHLHSNPNNTNQVQEYYRIHFEYQPLKFENMQIVFENIYHKSKIIKIKVFKLIRTEHYQFLYHNKYLNSTF